MLFRGFSLFKIIVITLAIGIAVFVLQSDADDILKYTGVLAALITLAGMLLNEKWQMERKKENTIKLILEAEASEFFQRQWHILEYDFLKNRAEKEESTVDLFDKYAKSGNRKEYEIAQAVISVLNFYEFLAYGALKGLFEKEVVKKNVRTMLCSLVYDLRYVIADSRKDNSNIYENLVALYFEWADRDAKNTEWDDEVEDKLG